MHAKIEQSLLFTEELDPLQSFMKAMKAYFQTFLGLANDFGTPGKKKSKRSRTRSCTRQRRFEYALD